MSPRSKKEYTEAIQVRYKNASRHEKYLILDEFCATCGYHRKHAIRIIKGFKRFAKPKAKRRVRSPVYQNNEDILKPLKEIWLATNLPCSKRLKVILRLWLPRYVQLFGDLSPSVSQALLSISDATIDRVLNPVRIHFKKQGRSTTKPGTLLRKQPVNFTRSKAYHKDDNAHVEQKTGPTSVNGSVTKDWINLISFLYSITSTAMNGDSSTTSSVHPKNSSPKKESAQKPSNNTTPPKPPTIESWNPLIFPIPLNAPSLNNLKSSTLLC